MDFSLTSHALMFKFTQYNLIIHAVRRFGKIRKITTNWVSLSHDFSIDS